MKTPPCIPLFRSSSYQVPRHPGPIRWRLDGNEGPLEPSFALSEMTAQQLRNYPDCSQLEAQIAQLYGLTPEQVLVTAGADDALSRICRAFLSSERNLIFPSPSFEMIERFAKWSQAEVRRVPWLSPGFPLPAVLSQMDGQTGLVAVVSPNNPTGLTASTKDLCRLAENSSQALVLVDAVYEEFTEKGLTQAALKYTNVVVCRSLSKAYGLAGLRLGYVLGAPEVISALRAAGMPYALSAPSIVWGSEAFTRGPNQNYLRRVSFERDDLSTRLSHAGFTPLPSQGNFVFAEVPSSRSGLWYRNAFAGLGIAIRAWPEDESLNSAIRISCPGNEEAYADLCQALGTIEQPQSIVFDLQVFLKEAQPKQGTPPRTQAPLWSDNSVVTSYLRTLKEKYSLGLLLNPSDPRLPELIPESQLKSLFSFLSTKTSLSALPQQATWLITNDEKCIPEARKAKNLPIGVLPQIVPERQRERLRRAGAAFVWPSWQTIEEQLR